MTNNERSHAHALAWGLALGLMWALTPASAQLAQKPSGYHPQGAALATRGASTPGWLPRLESRRDFDRVSRTFDAGTALALPHVLFVIDRSRGNEVQYIDAHRHALHEPFLKATRGVADFGPQGLKTNYRSPQRRYLLGTLAWQTSASQWAFEFWEGDQLTPELLSLAAERLGASFYAPLRFKPNSAQQEAVAASLGLPVLTQAELLKDQGFMPLNPGVAEGRLRVVDHAEAADDLAPDDIVLLREVPLTLPPVAGVLTTRPSTAISHVNLLAKGWGIPNAYVREVDDWLQLQGQWVRLTVKRTGATLAVVAPGAAPARRPAPRRWAAPDLRSTGLAPLSQLRVTDRFRCGSKAANLGALMAAQRRGALPGAAPVPDGFCVPFASFARFMAQPAAQQALREAQAAPGFERDRKVRAQALATLRERLQALPVSETDRAAWLGAWHGQLSDAGVFVRSSSNSEDLPGFSGAGLYTTVPNVTQAAALVDAVKTVWASVYNTEAWEARRWSGVPQDSVVMGVLVQTAVNAQASGVMATLNPFDPQQPNLSFITAKRGLGMRVVEGRRQAEQVLYNRRNNTIQVLSRTEDDTALLLDEHGGVKEQAVAVGRAVLSDERIRALAGVGAAVQRLLGPVAQDIEWALDPQDRIVLLQARPYVDRSAPGRR